MGIKKKREQWKEMFRQRYMPHPPGILYDARCDVHGGNWYAEVKNGVWYWYDSDDKKWKVVPYGSM